MNKSTDLVRNKDIYAQDLARYVGAFIDELHNCGVNEVVVSPGARSTALAMVAFASKIKIYVCVDERSAGFFALGLAKASALPVGLICTSGTAVANYFPAVLEAEASRVPLLIMSADRPAHMQELGAPQTCCQLQIFGSHVKKFYQMPEFKWNILSAGFCDLNSACTGSGAVVSGARQLRQYAKEAFLNSLGSGAVAGSAGPVHLNFPFDEPLTPDIKAMGIFDAEKSECDELRELASIAATSVPDIDELSKIAEFTKGKKMIVLAGEGSVANRQEARELIQWADSCGFVIYADVLSNLRSYNHPSILDSVSEFLDTAQGEDLCIIRFGRYPIAKQISQFIAHARPVQIVVDVQESRDFVHNTSVFVNSKPIDFVRAWASAPFAANCVASAAAASSASGESSGDLRKTSQVFSTEKPQAFTNEIAQAYVSKFLQLAPANSLVFAANSMSIRHIDAMHKKSEKQLDIMCNRGLNGIDGCLSSALGAAQHYPSTLFVTGDLAMLHDIGALALNAEITSHNVEAHTSQASITVLLLNNSGGGIFEHLPQNSSDNYFKRLFTTPQQVNFEHAAAAFGVPYVKAENVDEAAGVYMMSQGQPGINIIEVQVPLG